MSDNKRLKGNLEFDIMDAPMLVHALSIAANTAARTPWISSSRMAAIVAKDVHAGTRGQVVGEVAFAPLRIADLGGECAQLGQRLHTEVAQAPDQSVQHVDGCRHLP